MDRLKNIKQDLQRRWDAADQTAIHRQGRMIMATAMAVAILLPWLPVGQDASMSGSRLLSYGITSPELGQWIKANPLGTILFVSFGAAMTTVTLTMAWKTIQGKSATGNLLFIIGAPILVITFAQYPIFDQDVVKIGIVPVPQWGLTLMMMGSAALIAHTLWLNHNARRHNQANGNEQE